MEEETKKNWKDLHPTSAIGNIQYNLHERYYATVETMLQCQDDYGMFLKCFGYLKGLAYAMWLVDKAKNEDIQITTIFDDGNIFFVEPTGLLDKNSIFVKKSEC